jgi:hypothetical protein
LQLPIRDWPWRRFGGTTHNYFHVYWSLQRCWTVLLSFRDPLMSREQVYCWKSLATRSVSAERLGTNKDYMNRCCVIRWKIVSNPGLDLSYGQWTLYPTIQFIFTYVSMVDHVLRLSDTLSSDAASLEAFSLDQVAAKNQHLGRKRDSNQHLL